jgi:hypothetical protein
MAKSKTKQKNLAAVELGRLGGKARAKALSDDELKRIASEAGKHSRKGMTPKRKRAIARKAARARWAKERKQKGRLSA